MGLYVFGQESESKRYCRFVISVVIWANTQSQHTVLTVRKDEQCSFSVTSHHYLIFLSSSLCHALSLSLARSNCSYMVGD